jgi:hypothetical protein
MPVQVVGGYSTWRTMKSEPSCRRDMSTFLRPGQYSRLYDVSLVTYLNRLQEIRT